MTTRFFVDDEGVYLGGFAGAEPPPGAIEVPHAPQDARQIWDGSAWRGAPSAIITLYPADLWRRATDAEAEAIEAAIAVQPVRLRNIFRTASVFRSDDELWPLLASVAEGLFGAERAGELLAAS